jgi:ABC-type multidrug transport system ATPase subunit
MNITLEHVSKRFQRHWIFKDINYSFAQNSTYALLGANGSGKSTLLRILAGMQNPSLGKVHFFDDVKKAIAANQVFKDVSFCAPGQEIVEELTLREFLEFHFSFKRPCAGLDIDKIIELTGLQKSANRQVGDFSSGMKQRVKLAQAIFSETSVLLLDEPCTNLDQQGVEQYRGWIEQYSKNRMVIVASNDEREYFFCQEKLDIEHYK